MSEGDDHVTDKASPQIWAIRGYHEWAEDTLVSLRQGVGRFGWSRTSDGDLRQIKAKIDAAGWHSLEPTEQASWNPFLLEMKADDWVVYVNVPTWGKCVSVRVTGNYYWEFDGEDQNHKFPVDPDSIVRSFDRNEAIVPRQLSRKLKLQGRYWRINDTEEFQELRAALRSGDPNDTVSARQMSTPKSNAVRFGQRSEALLTEITRLAQKTHPNYDFEKLLAEVFARVPGVMEVVHQGGAGDHGADLLLRINSGLPFSGLASDELWVVQAKSYVGIHADLRAVQDIERAFEHKPTASAGLIVSTADESSAELDAAIESLSEKVGKPVRLLIGADVARFLLRYGGDLMGTSVG